MSLVFPKMKGDLIWSYSSLFVLAVSGILLNIVIAVGFGAERLGIFNQCFAIYIIAAQFSVGGIHFAVLKDVSVLRERPKQSISIWSGILGGLFLSFIVATTLFYFAGTIASVMKSPEMEIGIRWISIAIIFFGQNKIIFSALNGMRAIRSLSALQSLRYLFIIGLVVGVWRCELNPDFLLAVFLFGEFFLWLIAMSFLFFLQGFMLPDFLVAKKHFKFGLSAFLSGVLVELNTRVDVLVLGLFAGDKVVGIYSFGAMIAEGFYSLLVVVRTNLNPLIARYLAVSDYQLLAQLIKKTQKILYPTLAVVLCCLLFAYEPLVGIVLGQPDFLEAELVLLILLVGIWLVCGMLPFEWSLAQGGYPGSQSLLAVVVVSSNTVLNFMLIPIWGMVGAALATASSMMVALFCCSYLTRRILGIDVVLGKYATPLSKDVLKKYNE